MEMIKKAAIKRSDGIIVEGRDHAECILKSPHGTCTQGSIQGFVTTDGRFVDRTEAGKIAFEARQIRHDPKGGIIMSEEIWSFDGYCYYDDEKGYCFKDMHD